MVAWCLRWVCLNVRLGLKTFGTWLVVVMVWFGAAGVQAQQPAPDADPAPVVKRSLKRTPVKGGKLAPAPEEEQSAPPKASKPTVKTSTPEPEKAPKKRRVIRRAVGGEASKKAAVPVTTAAAKEEKPRTLQRETVKPTGEFSPVPVERKVVVKPAPKPEVVIKKVKAKPAPKSKPVDVSSSFVFVHPVKKVRITSHYGMRKHPKLKRRKMHKGTDFGGGTGTPVLATGPGRVLKAGRCGGGAGNCVVLQHANGWVSRYFHLSKVDTRSGKLVHAGQQIGRIGSTGRSTGPHLHFQIERNGHTANPVKAFGKRSNKVRAK